MEADDGDVLRRIRDICGAFVDAEEGALQDRPLFHVRRRRFAIFNGSTSPPRPRWGGCGQSLHLLSDPMERPALAHDERFFGSPHHAHQGWFAFRFDGSVDWDEVAELLHSARRQAARTQRPGS
jgi:predicted DNA-binding protein (MmcQ/YjbR family)